MLSVFVDISGFFIDVNKKINVKGKIKKINTQLVAKISQKSKLLKDFERFGMSAPIMPFATAVWLIDNTSLTFQQIADFCDLHVLEVQAIADGQAAIGIKGADPVLLGQLTKEELIRCEKDHSANLVKPDVCRTPGKKAKPKIDRKDKIRAICWLVRNYPIASDAEICRLLSTTKSVIKSIRDGGHPLSRDAKPASPVVLGICSQKDLDKLPRTASNVSQLHNL
ncbi:MAG: DUF1013 domain-containing protein [Holosporales bacterium]|nr:DUF1013 domain-containing protein [Holosporales bacterium]